MEGHVKKYVERHCEWANKNIEQLYKVSTHCLDDLHFTKEELETGAELPKGVFIHRPEMLLFRTHRQA